MTTGGAGDFSVKPSADQQNKAQHRVKKTIDLHFKTLKVKGRVRSFVQKKERKAVITNNNQLVEKKKTRGCYPFYQLNISVKQPL